jgi:predicted GTPase
MRRLNSLKKIFRKKVEKMKEFEGYEELKGLTKQILGAKEIGNKAGEETVNKMKRFIYQEYIPAIDKINIFENEYEVFKEIERRFEKWTSIQLKPWLCEKCVISLLGAFSSGKSSIVNSIIGEDLLPVDVTPTTAIPTYISYGPRKVFKFVDIEGKQREISEDVFKMLSKATRMADNVLAKLLFSYIRYCVMEFPLDGLADISLLDTPGYNSVDVEDIKKAKDVVKESDIILWVMDINDGTLSKDSINFIKEILSENPLPFYVVINKVDSTPPGVKVKVKEEVEKMLNKNDIKYEGCFFYTTKSNDENYKFYKNEMMGIIGKATSIKRSQNLKKYLEEILDEGFKRITEKYKMWEDIREDLKRKKTSEMRESTDELIKTSLAEVSKNLKKLKKLDEELKNLDF